MSVHLCVDTLTESPMLFLNVLLDFECDFLHVELSGKKKFFLREKRQSNLLLPQMS